MKKLKKLYERRAYLAKESCRITQEFDAELEEYYEFCFNETDDDAMIDTLDYGTQSITFEEFIERMDFYKKDTGESYDSRH